MKISSLILVVVLAGCASSAGVTQTSTLDAFPSNEEFFLDE
ncbi:hypothetical protein [Amylibacter sp. SFDW26]|nr:hypothetical protein [Amylibacter sp. SFDW26]